jgi:hypothetical protein
MTAAGRLRALARSHSALVLGLFVALAVAMFIRAWRDPGAYWIGFEGDPAQHGWFLRWVPFAVGSGRNPLFTDFLNFPDGVNLMWNTTMPLLGLVLTPVTLLAGPVVTYNLVVTLGVALSGWTAYLVLRRYVRSSGAALAGALLYGFSPYMANQSLQHSNLVQAYTPPLLFLLLDEALVRQRRSPYVVGGLMGALAAAQIVINEELLATEAVAALAGVLVLVALRPRDVRARLPHAVKTLAVGAVVGLALAAYPLIYQFAGPQRATHGVLQPTEVVSSDLLSFVVPSELQQISPGFAEDITQDFTGTCCKSEWGSYVGLPLLALLGLVAVRCWRNLLVRFAAVWGVAMAVLSLGGNLHVRGTVTDIPLPFWVVEQFPVVSNMLPQRLMLYFFLAAALLVAVFVDTWRERPQRARTGAYVLLGVALLALVPAVPFPADRAQVPSFFTSGGVRRIPEGSVALVLPFATTQYTSDPMLWQAVSDMRFRMPEGYIAGANRDGKYVYLPDTSRLSSTMEELWARGEDLFSLDLRLVVLKDMADRDVTSVIVGPTRHQRAFRTFFTKLLERPPQRTGGVYVWFDVDPDALLAVTPIQ